jgi:hypothetical protein
LVSGTVDLIATTIELGEAEVGEAEPGETELGEARGGT